MDLKTTINNAIEKYLVSFAKSLLTKFYTKNEVDEAVKHDNIDTLNKFTEDTDGNPLFNGSKIVADVHLDNQETLNKFGTSDNNKATFNGKSLYDEDDINALKINDPTQINVTLEDGTTKTLQEVITMILAGGYTPIPTPTDIDLSVAETGVAEAGTAECGA
jgi:hypothetical protein